MIHPFMGSWVVSSKGLQHALFLYLKMDLKTRNTNQIYFSSEQPLNWQMIYYANYSSYLLS